LGSHRMPGWTALFLLTTILTSVTGFLFPFTTLLPSHIVGIISLVVLAIALLALYGFGLRGAWRWIYVVTAVGALYLNSFVAVGVWASYLIRSVGVGRASKKLHSLHVGAPPRRNLPFLTPQLVVWALLVVLAFPGGLNSPPPAAAEAVPA